MIHARQDYNRIQDPSNLIGVDEPVFLIRAKDSLSLKAVMNYIQLMHQFLPMNSDTKEMVDKLEQHVNRFRQWQETNAHLVKYPDMPDNAGHIYDTFVRSMRATGEVLAENAELKQAVADIEAKLKNYASFNYDSAAREIEALKKEASDNETGWGNAAAEVANLREELKAAKELIEDYKKST